MMLVMKNIHSADSIMFQHEKWPQM